MSSAIHHGDGFAALREMPADSAALVFLDPEWGNDLPADHVGAFEVGVRNHMGGKKSYWWDSPAMVDTVLKALQVAPHVLLKLSAKIAAERAIFALPEPLRYCLAERFQWDKGPGAPAFCNAGVSDSLENLWWFTRDGSRVRNAEWKAIQRVVRLSVEDDPEQRRVGRVLAKDRLTDHPWEMPRGLCEWIVRGFTRPGDRIIDVCTGSGALVVHGENMGRVVEGWETNEKWVAQARAALEHDGRPMADRQTPELFTHSSQ